MSLEKEPLLNGDQLIHERPPAYSASTTPVLQTAPRPNDVHVQYRYGAQQMENPPYTCMIPAVLASLFCCWPLGLAAILKASEAESAIKAGNRQQAEASSASARTLTIASVSCGIFITVATFPVIVHLVLERLKSDDGVPDY